MPNEAQHATQSVVTLSRVVDAQPDRVFAAWTEAGQLEKWFGPPGYEVRVRKLDVRVGGEFEFVMQPPEAEDPARSIVGTFKEIAEPRHLVFTWAWVDENGSAPDAGESLVTVEFRTVVEGTKVCITHERLASEESRAGHHAGWSGSLDKLAAYFS